MSRTAPPRPAWGGRLSDGLRLLGCSAIGATAISAALWIAPQCAVAQGCVDGLCALTSGSSRIEIDARSGVGLDWLTIGGAHQVDPYGWIYYQVGAAGSGAPGAEQVLGDRRYVGGTLGLELAEVDAVAGTVSLVFQDAALRIELDYHLQASADPDAGASLVEALVLENRGAAAVDLRLFDVAGFNLDLGGADGLDRAQLGARGRLFQADLASDASLRRSASPAPDHFELAASYALSDALEGASSTTALNDVAAIVTADGVETVLAWDVFDLAPGERRSIDITTTVLLPEPDAIPGALAAILTLVRLRRARRS